MTQSRGLRGLIALVSGSLAWRALFPAAFYTGGAAIVQLFLITAVAALFAVLVFGGLTLRALIALTAGVLAWKALLLLLFVNGGAIIQMILITAVSALFAAVVFHGLPRTQTPTTNWPKHADQP